MNSQMGYYLIAVGVFLALLAAAARVSVSKMDNCGFSYAQRNVSTIWRFQQPNDDENNAVVAYPDSR
jgi:hypothetical protein